MSKQYPKSRRPRPQPKTKPKSKSTSTPKPARVPGRSTTRVKQPADWDAVDWSQQSCVIARQLGCSRQRVSQVRQALGEPHPPGAGVSPWIHALQRRIDNLLTRWPEAPNTEIARRAKCSAPVVATRRRILGVPRPAAVHRCDLMDWRLIDTDLMRIWRFPTPVIIGVKRRILAGGVRPMYHYPTQTTATKQRMRDPVYAALYAAEQRKARRYFARNPTPEPVRVERRRR